MAAVPAIRKRFMGSLLGWTPPTTPAVVLCQFPFILFRCFVRHVSLWHLADCPRTKEKNAAKQGFRKRLPEPA